MERSPEQIGQGMSGPHPAEQGFQGGIYRFMRPYPSARTEKVCASGILRQSRRRSPFISEFALHERLRVKPKRRYIFQPIVDRPARRHESFYLFVRPARGATNPKARI